MIQSRHRMHVRFDRVQFWRLCCLEFVRPGQLPVTQWVDHSRHECNSPQSCKSRGKSHSDGRYDCCPCIACMRTIHNRELIGCSRWARWSSWWRAAWMTPPPALSSWRHAFLLFGWIRVGLFAGYSFLQGSPLTFGEGPFFGATPPTFRIRRKLLPKRDSSKHDVAVGTVFSCL